MLYIPKIKRNRVLFVAASLILCAYRTLQADTVPQDATNKNQQPISQPAMPLASLGEPIDQVIASVNDQPIFKFDLESELQLYASRQKKGMPLPSKADLLEKMITLQLLLDAAEQKNIVVKKEEVDRYVDQKLKMILDEVGSKEKLEKLTGKPLSSFKANLDKTTKEQMTIEQLKRKVIDDISISPAEVKTFFEEADRSQVPFLPAKVEAYQIVLYPTIEQDERTNLLDKLNLLKQRIKQGEDFATLANEYSTDSATSIQGGELGFCPIGALEPTYERAALNLLPGEVSDPIETRAGFHLIQLIERRRGEYNSRHILLKPTSSEPSLQMVFPKLEAIREAILHKKISFEEAAKKHSQDGATLPKNGLITGEMDGVFTQVDQLPPDLFFVLDKLKPGEISPPIIFTDTAGKKGVRIVFLKKKVAAHRISLETDYEQIYQIALENKKAKIVEDWLAGLKQKARIEINKSYSMQD